MEASSMIRIVKQRNLPFQQSFGKRRLILLREATRYTDGQQPLLWLSFQNDFNEPTFAMQLELTQFNRDYQVIEKSRIQLKEFVCAPHLQQTIASPMIIADACEAVSVKIIAVSFRTLELNQDVFVPAIQSLPAVKPVSSKRHQSGALKITNPLGWLPVWVYFWMVVAFIMIVATFQFGLI
jgi:hypothetical protein